MDLITACTALVALFVGVFVWRRAARIHARERAAFVAKRDAFASGRRCPKCQGGLNLDRLHHPLDGKEELTEHWLNVCQCGELTVWDAGAQAHHVDDRSPSR
jgi:hypothetical protein